MESVGMKGVLLALFFESRFYKKLVILASVMVLRRRLNLMT